MKIWLAIAIVALVTLFERASFILLLSRWRMPVWFAHALRYVPVAVFPALIAPLFLRTDGQLDISFSNLKIAAGLVAILVAWRSKSLLATIVAGMLALWLLQLAVSFR